MAQQRHNDAIRKKRAAKNRIKKLRAKEAKRIKKVANSKRREMLQQQNELLATADKQQEITVDSRQLKKKMKLDSNAVDSKLDSGLEVGVFCKFKSEEMD